MMAGQTLDHLRSDRARRSVKSYPYSLALDPSTLRYIGDTIKLGWLLFTSICLIAQLNSSPSSSHSQS